MIVNERPRLADEGGSSRVVVVGAGFTGMSAAWDLLKAGHSVTLLEKDKQVGGLASGFPVGDVLLERFYHHWFASDRSMTEFIEDLGLKSMLVERRTQTGMYFANSFFRLSAPLDVLRLTALSFIDRLRLGALVLQARRIRDWKALESVSARDWLISLCGESVYRVVWEPLMRGKFGDAADEISAVWIWNKLCLRGGSRSSDGHEILYYYRGGFAALANSLIERLIENGALVETNTEAQGLRVENGVATAVLTANAAYPCDEVLLTTPLPAICRILDRCIPEEAMSAWKQVRYLGNICLILVLDRSLSDLYWINVNDPSFPFVGLIEHTNFEPPTTYAGKHIVYLSKYLPTTDPMYRLSDDDYLQFAMPYIKAMFPAFSKEWILAHHIWRADFAQPIVGRNYSRAIPPQQTTISNVSVATMAQIYPEDRGTNYAVREGRAVARKIIGRLKEGMAQ